MRARIIVTRKGNIGQLPCDSTGLFPREASMMHTGVTGYIIYSIQAQGIACVNTSCADAKNSIRLPHRRVAGVL